jgi:hypothetical protein
MRGSLIEEGCKSVLLIAASILAVRKLAQYDSGARVPATVSAIADAVRWEERVKNEKAPVAVASSRNTEPSLLVHSLRRRSRACG